MSSSIRKEFMNHGWEVFNHFTNGGTLHYDVLKDDLRLHIEEEPGFLSAHCSNRGIQLEGELITWDNLMRFLFEYFKELQGAASLHMQSSISCIKKAKRLL